MNYYKKIVIILLLATNTITLINMEKPKKKGKDLAEKNSEKEKKAATQDLLALFREQFPNYIVEKYGNYKVSDKNPTDAFAKAIKNLVALGADVNAEHSWGSLKETPLLYAVQLPHIYRGTDMATIVKTLLAAGADVNKYNPLVAAASTADPSVVQVLIEAGANVNAKGTSGSTALISALFGLYPIKRLELLISAGANINDRDAQGQTVLHHAVKEVIRIYQAYNNPPRGQNQDLYKTTMDIVKFLIDLGANTAIADNSGNTPLGLARAVNVPGLVQLLQTAPNKSKQL